VWPSEETSKLDLTDENQRSYSASENKLRILLREDGFESDYNYGRNRPLAMIIKQKASWTNRGSGVVLQTIYYVWCGTTELTWNTDDVYSTGKIVD